MLLYTTRKRTARVNAKYTLNKEYSTFRVFVKKYTKEGLRVIPLKMARHTLTLVYKKTNEVVEFKYTFTPRNGWGWTDSRIKGRQTASYVADELARMLFRGDRMSGALLVNRILAQKFVA